MSMFQVLMAVGLAIGFCVSGMSLMKAQARAQQMQKRVSSVVVSPTRIKPAGMAISLFTESNKQRGTVDQITALFGFSLEKLDHYPLQWWVILGLTAAGAYFSCVAFAYFMTDFVRLLTPLAWIGLSRMVFSWYEGRRRDKLFGQFPDALAMIVRSVRVGIPVTEAVRAVARELPDPTAPAFRMLADEVAIGVPFDEALMHMADRNGVPEYRFFATALSLQQQTGGALSETLENLAEVIRKRVALRERGNALASEAKTSAGVLAALPPLAGGALYLLNPSYMSILFTDPAGKKVLAMAVVMLGGGIMIMRWIIKRSLR